MWSVSCGSCTGREVARDAERWGAERDALGAESRKRGTRKLNADRRSEALTAETKRDTLKRSRR